MSLTTTNTCAGGTPDIRSYLNEEKASEDAHTALERARGKRLQATVEQVSSGLPTVNSTTSDDDNDPYGAGCQAFTASLRWVN